MDVSQQGLAPSSGGSARGPGAVRRSLPLIAWVGALAGVLAAAMAIGSSPAFAGPTSARPGELATWAAGRSPVEAAFALLRVVVICLAAYLLVGTAVVVVARVLRAGRLLAVVDVVTLRWTRHVVELALGAGLLTVPLTANHAGATDRWAITASEVPPEASGGDGAGPADPVARPAWQHGPPTMQRLDPPEQVAAASSEVVVGAGDHLWSVAERALAAAWGRAPVDEEVAPFWEQVVEVNRARLADPANPDLLFVGQVVAVPAPPPHVPA